MKIKCLITLAALIGFSALSALAGETKTLISGDSNTDVLALAEGESAKLVYAHDTNTSTGSTTAFGVRLTVTKGSKEFTIPTASNLTSGAAPSAPVEIAGPATLRISHNQSPDKPNIATFSVTRVGTYTEPACIPIEAGSNFRVILESSSDLVNWTPANPGSYSGTEAKRFFRTRIVKQ